MAEATPGLVAAQRVFQIHFWIGAVAGLYLALMSVSGSIIVYRETSYRDGPLPAGS